jgi:hypothetical protein
MGSLGKELLGAADACLRRRMGCSDEFQESLRQMRALEAERSGGSKRARGKALQEVRRARGGRHASGGRRARGGNVSRWVLG